MAAVTLKQMCRFMFRWGLCIAAVESWSVGNHYGAAACVGDAEDRKSRARAMDRLRLCYLGAAAIGCRFRGWQTPSTGERQVTQAGMDQFAVRRQYDEEWYKSRDGADYFCVTDADLSAEAWHGGAGGGSTPLLDGKRVWNFKLGFWIVMQHPVSRMQHE